MNADIDLEEKGFMVRLEYTAGEAPQLTVLSSKATSSSFVNSPFPPISAKAWFRMLSPCMEGLQCKNVSRFPCTHYALPLS